MRVMPVSMPFTCTVLAVFHSEGAKVTAAPTVAVMASPLVGVTVTLAEGRLRSLML